MKQSRVAREQSIAVFGEAGSGKTVLLSSFYGSAQEGAFRATSPYDVVAEDTAQGRRLHQNFLGMKNAAKTPITDRFRASRYVFSIKRRPSAPVKGKQQKRAAEELRLVWHDYPGEWFEEDPASQEEQDRRTETFRSLLGADVAVLLVDAQRLIDNVGEEERYLKALLTNYSTHLSRLRDDIAEDGGRLVRFPRIWLFGLSKADLLPDLDVVAFRDLMVEKVGAEMNRLQDELSAFVEEPEAFSLGEDFVLLSSARFEPGRIDVDQQIGVRLVLPIAAMLPFSRHVRWAGALHKGSKVADELMKHAGPVLLLVMRKVKLPGPLRLVSMFLPMVADSAVRRARTAIHDVHESAKDRHDFLTTVLSGFRLDLDRAVEERILQESPK